MPAAKSSAAAANEVTDSPVDLARELHRHERNHQEDGDQARDAGCRA